MCHRLFGDRYKAVLVEGAGYYYETLLDDVHLNPVRAGLADRRKGQSVLDYAWSSVSQWHPRSTLESPIGHDQSGRIQELIPFRRRRFMAAQGVLE